MAFQGAPVEKHPKSAHTGHAARAIGKASENPDTGWHPAGLGGETAPEVTTKAPGQSRGAPGTDTKGTQWQPLACPEAQSGALPVVVLPHGTLPTRTVGRKASPMATKACVWP